MSSFAGIYNFDGSTDTDNKLIALWGEHSEYTGDVRKCQTGSLGILYQAFITNKASSQEIQPLISNEGHILCWDGRLDNREDLLQSLRNELRENHSDASIVMEAFQKWGMNFFSKLVGDFALSVWDANARAVLLARDPVGIRPLFYQLDQNAIIWSSELSPLLNLVRDEIDINDEYIAGYLTRHPEPWLTPYKHIYAVPPGNVIIAHNSQPHSWKFWSLDPGRKIRYRRDEEYEEHFRYLFRESVSSRLRVAGTVWAQLSGGLDSSAIVCMADEIINSGEVEASKLETVSYIYDESTSSDERDFIRLVEEKRMQNSFYLRDNDYPPFASIPIGSQISFPDFLDSFADRHNALCDAMRACGARVLLTGHGGDEMLGSAANPSSELGDLLAQCKPVKLHRSLRTWSKALRKSYIELLLLEGVLPLFPNRLRLACTLKPHFKPPPWLNSKFVSRLGLCERYLGPNDIFGFDLPSERNQALGFLSAVRVTAKSSYRTRGNIEVSHPYLHIPLVEFLQAIPCEQRVRPGETRSLMRRALRDLLPEKILNRRSKRGPDEAFFRSISRKWMELQPIFKTARVCEHGYVDNKSLLIALERAQHGCEQHAFALQQVITLEFWLRSLEFQGLTARKAVE